MPTLLVGPVSFLFCPLYPNLSFILTLFKNTSKGLFIKKRKKFPVHGTQYLLSEFQVKGKFNFLVNTGS